MLRIKEDALTFDDVLLIPSYSEYLPHTVSVKTHLTKRIILNIPLLSASMDTVTESALATVIAQHGGMGIIHKNMSIIQQAHEVKKVKTYPITLTEFPNACIDEFHHLRVGAGVGVGGTTNERVAALVEAGVDILVIDSSHGHSKGVLEQIKEIRQNYPKLQIIGGNVATAEGALSLLDVGIDAIKVGIGPGSICTTRIVTGVGVPQITAISEVSEIADKYDIPVIADGGIRYSGDICKAIAAGASSVMLGSIFAGTEEAPGEIELYNDKKYKIYRGMGSMGAMANGSSDRYFQDGKTPDKLVPEGIEGKVEYKGPVKDIIYQQIGGLRACMGLTGCVTIQKLRTQTKFMRISSAGIRESHVHDINLIQSAPNYKID